MNLNRDSRLTQIGVDRLVRLKWLKQTASLVLAGNDAATIKSILQNDIRGAFRSDNIDVCGSINKTIRILIKVWLRVPEELEPLRVGGLELLQRLPQEHHIAVNWGMIMAAYPFWMNVSIQVGRLLKLQGSLAAVQVQRRIRENYGERETVSRRARYVLSSFVEWGVLNQTTKKGIYTAGASCSIDDPQLITWLVEASLHARPSGSAPLKDLVDSPGLFPFHIKTIRGETMMMASSNIDIVRHGLDDDLVMLKKSGKKLK